MIKASVKSQRGAAAIEFSVVFILLFLIFYSIVGYFFPFLLKASYEEIASEALRAAINDPAYMSYADMGSAKENYLGVRNSVARDVIDKSWIPDKWKKPCSANNEYLSVDLTQGAVWSVCIGISSVELKKIIPVINLYAVEVPSLPESLQATAKIRVY